MRARSRAAVGARLAGAALVAAALLSTPVDASAQYFGRNKVVYDEFDWRVLETPYFHIYHYPEEEVAVADAARMADRWHSRLGSVFQHRLSAEQPIILYANHPDFQQTNLTSGLIGEGTGGFTEGLRRRVAMPLTGVYAENDHVLGHELVHAYQYDLATGRGGFGLEAMSRLPLWLIEGMAEYLSVGRVDPHTAMWLRDAALRADLPTIAQLNQSRFFPYRYGEALMAYIGGRWGDRAVTQFYRYAARQGLEQASRSVLGVSLADLSAQWIESIRTTYYPLVQGRTPPERAGTPILTPEKDAGEMNVSPTISPDGRYVAFLSEMSLFSIDLFLADAHTGEVLDKLVSSSTSGHFDAISFINSAGSWSPDGRYLAFIVYAEGDNEIAIIDAQRRKVDRRIRVETVGAMTSPSWSPDGRTLAFSGNVGGISDLYVLDLESGATRQLTNDRYADLHPEWSPDGRSLAFVTDRGPATDFQRLTYGNMRLALIDVASGELRALEIFEDAKHINPQFSPDGSQLYFVSDNGGFQDVYRLTLATGAVEQITNLATGASGITELSPAITVARNTGRLLFSVFEKGNYNVYALEPDALQPLAATPAPVTTAGVLPPLEALNRTLVGEYLADPVAGLPVEPNYAILEYDPQLELDYIGSSGVGFAVNRYGAGAAGGLVLFFSDMLGNRNVGAAIQANGALKDVGGEALYLNREGRWAWGVTGGHLPYITSITGGVQAVDPDSVSGPPEVIQTQSIRRMFVDQVTVLTHYPFSQTRRFEASAGYTHLFFDTDSVQWLIRAGRVVGERTFDGHSPPGLNLFQASGALVGDWAFFGFTSPVSGGRYRLELQPTTGTLTFLSTLADYRRYFMLGHTSVAMRGLHFGRWGEEAQVEQITPLFLGHPSLVRGYGFGSFDGEETQGCAGSTFLNCPVTGRLVGTGIAVANLEYRIQLFGVEQFGLIAFPYLPLEIAPFLDAGVAWTADDPPEWRFDTSDPTARVPVFSTGVTARANVLGYLILEVFYAYPFQRPDKGWHWGFNIAPGW